MARRIQQLRRLARVRAAQRQQALADLALAQTEQQRLSGLADRSRAMLSDYSARADVETGQNLASLHAFRGQIHRLAIDAETMGEAATGSADAARVKLHQAEHRLGHADARLRKAQSQAAARQQQRSASSAPSRMARALQKAPTNAASPPNDGASQ